MGIIDKSLKLGNRERMIRACLNLDIDRLPYWFMFGLWPETMPRWQNEGFPKERCENWREPFGFDTGFEALPVNLGFYPEFERKVISEDGDKITIRDTNGSTYTAKAGQSGIPHFIDFAVKNREDWESIKNERLDPNSPERFPHDWLNVLKAMKERDAAIQIGSYPYGLFGTLRDFMGFEGLLLAFYEEPELIKDMMDYLTDFWITIYTKALNDIQIDHIHIWEDMSGKTGPLISPAMFREFIKPNYLKIVDFANQNNIPVISVDTDGNMDIMMPLLEESGINFVFPFEVQAGCDIVEYRKEFPGISIHGGIDKRKIALGRDETDKELDRINELFNKSGYIPALDHLVPPDISYNDFCYFTDRLKQMIGIN